MNALNGTLIFWFITLGLILGAIFGSIIKKEGITIIANLVWGTIGSVLTGSVALVLGFSDGLMFALVGTLAVLFLVNVFHQHHQEDVAGHIDQDINIYKGMP